MLPQGEEVVLDHNNKPLHNIKENNTHPAFWGQEEGSNHKYFYQVQGGKCECKNQLQGVGSGETHSDKPTILQYTSGLRPLYLKCLGIFATKI